MLNPLVLLGRFWYSVVGSGPKTSLTADTTEVHCDCEITLTKPVVLRLSREFAFTTFRHYFLLFIPIENKTNGEPNNNKIWWT